MFDPYSGRFKSQKDYLRDVRGSDIQPDVRKVWHDVIREFRERKENFHYRKLALLRNQLLYYEFTESYASDFNPDYNYETELLPFDKEKSFSIFRDKFQNGYYDCIMVDEVQDLPIIAVNMLSFLSPSREPNRFILSGDKYQTLNGQEFLWEQFLVSLTAMTARISEEHSQFIFHDKNTKRPYDHHLKGLFWSKEAIDTVIKNRLVENFRNHLQLMKLPCTLGRTGHHLNTMRVRLNMVEKILPRWIHNSKGVRLQRLQTNHGNKYEKS